MSRGSSNSYGGISERDIYLPIPTPRPEGTLPSTIDKVSGSDDNIVEQKQTKKFFLVCCKCGHVGRGKFIPLIFPIYAHNAKDAAAVARHLGSVKHNHRDAILWVREVSKKVYLQKRAELDHDIYWQGARRNDGALVDRLEYEPGYHRFYNQPDNKKTTREYRHTKKTLSESEIYKDIVQEYGISL
jgi:hypothetical protein